MAPVRMNWLPTKNATASRMRTITMVVRDEDEGFGFFELLSAIVSICLYW